MGNIIRVKRIQSPPRVRRKKPDSLIVADVITTSVEPKFCLLTNRKPKDCTNKHVYNKYKHVFEKIAKYLVEIRGEYKNSLESLAYDYMTSIYKRYAYYKKTPFLTQLAPSQNNQIKFEEWIHRCEEDKECPYWVEEDKYNSALEIAKKHVEMSRQKIADAAEDFEILEI